MVSLAVYGIARDHFYRLNSADCCNSLFQLLLRPIQSCATHLQDLNVFTPQHSLFNADQCSGRKIKCSTTELRRNLTTSLIFVISWTLLQSIAIGMNRSISSDFLMVTVLIIFWWCSSTSIEQSKTHPQRFSNSLHRIDLDNLSKQLNHRCFS